MPKTGDFNDLVGVFYGALPGFIAGLIKRLYLSSFGNGIDTLILFLAFFFGGCGFLRLYRSCDPGYGLYNKPEISDARRRLFVVLSSIAFGLIFYAVGAAVADTFWAVYTTVFPWLYSYYKVHVLDKE